jgi:hypothetical protein
MIDTALITQAVIAGFESELANLEARLTELEQDLASTTAALTNALNTSIGAVQLSLSNHINQNYTSAHGGITAYTGKYRDSGNALVGDQIIQLVIGNSTYYIPATQDVGGLCHSQCHCDCHCRGSW